VFPPAHLLITAATQGFIIGVVDEAAGGVPSVRFAVHQLKSRAAGPSTSRVVTTVTHISCRVTPCNVDVPSQPSFRQPLYSSSSWEEGGKRGEIKVGEGKQRRSGDGGGLGGGGRWGGIGEEEGVGGEKDGG